MKAYNLGQILLDKDGVWHVQFLGEHRTPEGLVFGPGTRSSKSLSLLLRSLRVSLNRSKRVYLEHILALEAAKDEVPPTE